MMDNAAHLKYMTGEPLTEELRAIRDGKAQAFEGPQVVRRKPITDADRELKRRERVDLKELMAADGYEVARRVFEKIVHVHENSAISLSKRDPLGNQAEIANTWAYVAIAKQVQQEFFSAIEYEVGELDKEETDV